MPRMIPATSRSGANSSERRVYNAFEGIMDRPDWIVFHSLPVRQHVDKEMGEADFVVVVPERGIVVIETKSPKQVDYKAGVWTLNRTPQPHKNPFEQIDGALASIRAYLRREGAIEGTEPFARLVWFTSLGRHHFGGRAPSDLSFFEWELAWADDVRYPTRTIEKVLTEHEAWQAEHKNMREDPASLTAEKAQKITGALLRDFSVEADLKDALRESDQYEVEAMAEQRFALELVESNRAVYFDGPAGSGKSYLLARAAFNAVQRGERTLLTCWNLEMAQRLRQRVTIQGPLSVMDLGTVMLKVAGLDAHPHGATSAWYEEQLPTLALRALEAERIRRENRSVQRPQPGAPSQQPGAPSPQPGAPSPQPGAPSQQPGAPSAQPGAQRGPRPAPPVAHPTAHPTPRPPTPALGGPKQLGGYANVIVDEFQDVAANPLLVDVILALAAPDAHLMFAGDSHQQIMRTMSDQVDPFTTLKERLPDLVHANIRRNCRQVPSLMYATQNIVGRQFGFTAVRLPQSAPGGATEESVPEGNEVAALTHSLRELTKQFGDRGVVVLSPWNHRSLIARALAGEFDESAYSADLRWLHAHLDPARSDEEAIRYGSISALKGIETDAVVLTDAGPNGQRWAAENDLSWEDLLYVGLSRAKYQAIVLRQDEPACPDSAPPQPTQAP